MTKKLKEAVKKLACISMAAMMTVTLMPAMGHDAFAGSGQSESGTSTDPVDSILTLDNWTTTSPLSEYNLATPYGKDKNQPFLLEEQNEVLVYNTTNYSDGGAKSEKIASDYRFAPSSFEPDGSNSLAHQELYNSQLGNEELGNTKVYAFVNAVGFDPKGSGRKDHVAYIGYDASSGKIVTWIRDVKNRTQSEDYTVTGDCSWIMTDDHRLRQSEARNFFQITAGDYDGDNKDEIVVYSPENNDAFLQEYEVGTDGLTLTAAGSRLSLSTMTGARYGQLSSKPKNKAYKLSCSLTSGDFDGDGVEEMAAAVGSCNFTGDTVDGGKPVFSSCSSEAELRDNMAVFSTYLSVFDNSDSGSLSQTGSPKKLIEKVGGPDTDTPNAVYTYRMLYAGTASAADVNQDGQDEIIVAGYSGNPTATYYGSAQGFNVFDMDKTHLAASVIAYGSGNYTAGSLQYLKMNNYTSSGFKDDKDNIWPKTAVCCGYVSGRSAGAQVFIDGTVYSVNGTEITPVYTAGFFNREFSSLTVNTDDNSTESGTSEVFDVRSYCVETVTAGNFNHNDDGQEQFTFTLQYRGDIGNDNEYTYKLGNMGGRGYDNGVVTSYYVSVLGYHDGDHIQRQYYNVWNKGDDPTNKRVNLVPVSVDSDNDGVIAQYDKVACGYTDPQVQSVLQAAPYFDELGDYDNHTNNETSYTVTSSYTVGQSSSTTTSLSYGFTGEGSLGLATAGVEAGRTSEFTKNFEQEYEKEYSTTFTAVNKDTVIVQRTPVAVFTYDVLKKDGKWAKDGYHITVPLKPVYYQLSVDNYNRLVKEYNAKQDANNKAKNKTKLIAITEADLPDSTGEPFNYWKKWADAGNGGETLSKDSSYPLGYNGGWAQSEWSKSGSTTEGIEQSHGIHLSFTLAFGTDVELIGGYHAGAYIEAESSTTTGTYKTTTNAKGAAGTVWNLDESSMKADSGISEAVTRAYGFNWNFGKWERQLNSNQENVMFFGYTLTGVKAPSPEATDLSAEAQSVDTVDLTWTAPEADSGRPSVTGYNVYKKASDGEWVLAAGNLPADANSYEFTGLDSNTKYEFTVTTQYSGGEGMYAPSASVTTPKMNYTLTLSSSPAATAIATAAHDGNVELKSGDKCPEETIVFVDAKAKDGYAITGYSIISGGTTKTKTVTSCESKEFNFMFRNDTEVQILTERVSSIVNFGVNDVSLGAVSASIGGDDFESGGTARDSLQFTATPKSGQMLLNWTVTDGSGTTKTVTGSGNKLKLDPVNGPYTVAANFANAATQTKVITISTVNNGKITVTNSSGNTIVPVNGSITLPSGSTVTITAVPDNYYRFDRWTGDFANETGAAVTKTVDADISIGAEFYAPMLYTVNYGLRSGSPSNSGTVTGSEDSNVFTSGTTLPAGSTADFTADANSGYRVNGWFVNDKAAGQGALVTAMSQKVSEPLTVEAAFEAYYTVKASAGAGGFITPSGDTTVAAGKDITYQIYPYSGYEISDVLVDGNSVGKVSSQTFANVNSNHTISVTFKSNGGAAGGNTAVSSAPVANAITYNGAAQQLVTPAAASNGTMMFSLTKDGKYSEAIPASVNAGKYTVYYYMKGANGQSDSPVASIDVTIAPKTIGLKWTGKSFTYDGSSHSPAAIAEGLVGSDKCSVKVTGASSAVGVHSAKAESVDNSNYCLPENADQTFQINKILIMKATKKDNRHIQLQWTKYRHADGYVIYYRSSTAGKWSRLKTLNADSTSLTTKKLSATKEFKFLIKAYKDNGGGRAYIAFSPVVCEAMGTSRTNAEQLSVNDTSISLTPGSVFLINASISETEGSKNASAKDSKLRYFSSNSEVASVSSSGRILGVNPGKCSIYVVANNGVWKKINIIVK